MSYIPHTQQDIKEMLKAIGEESLDSLFHDLPKDMMMSGDYQIPSTLSEPELVKLLKVMASQNEDLEKNISLLGAGSYEHFIPVLVDHLSGRSEFSTAYTPYQPEASQGSLQAIFEYQTTIAEITGLDVSNASLYDGPTGLAEAMILAYAQHREKRKLFLLPASLHPEYREVAETYMKNLGVEIAEIPEKDGLIEHEKLAEMLDQQVAAVVVASPNFYGLVEDMEMVAAAAHKVKALAISVVNPVSLAILKTPGECDIDIAIGDGQPLGIPQTYGGPSFGFMATKKAFLRKIPGRIVGQTVDERGERGFVLTIQTREQHIRREKATSNICSNQALMALRGLIHLTCLGKEGFYEVAEQCLQKAHYFAQALAKLPGYKLTYSQPFFNEFVLHCPKPAELILKALEEHHVYGGVALSRWFPERPNELLIAVTECRTREQLDQVTKLFGAI